MAMVQQTITGRSSPPAALRGLVTSPPPRRRKPRHVPILAFGIPRTALDKDEAANLDRLDKLKVRALARDHALWVDTEHGAYRLYMAREWQASLLGQARSLVQSASDLAIPIRIAVHFGQVQLVEVRLDGGQTRLVAQPGDLLDAIKWFLTPTAHEVISLIVMVMVKWTTR
jgi:hypothetical protein